MSSPSEQLAVLVVERLVAEGLVTEGDAAKLTTRVVAGTMSAEDWRLAIEKTTPAKPE